MKFKAGDKVTHSGMIGTVINTGWDGKGHYNVDVDFGGKLVKTFINGRGLTAVKEPKKSTLLELDCEQFGGKVKIIAIRNGMGFDDIRIKYGEEALHLYRTSDVKMSVHDEDFSIWNQGESVQRVKVTDILANDEFSSIVSLMKKAGDTLVKAIQQAKQVKKFTITV